MIHFLFIPSIQSGNFEELYVKCSVILIFWVLVILAVLLDLWSGIDRAKVLREKMRSDKLRRTIDKTGDYWRFLAFGLIIDVIASILPFYVLPYASILMSIACTVIEGKSVFENAKAKKSVAAKIPDVMSELLQCTDKEKMTELLKKWNDLSDKHKTKTKTV